MKNTLIPFTFIVTLTLLTTSCGNDAAKLAAENEALKSENAALQSEVDSLKQLNIDRLNQAKAAYEEAQKEIEEALKKRKEEEGEN